MPPNRAARHRDVDVADLERELAEFRDIIDGWVGENVARERRLRDAHDRRILRLEREYDALINRERELSERAAENAREAERYETEAEQALEETNAARELAEGLPEQLAALREARRGGTRRRSNTRKTKRRARARWRSWTRCGGRARCTRSDWD